MPEQIRSLKTGIKHKKTPIGEVPVDWEIKRLIETASSEKYSFTGGPFGSDLKEDSYTDHGVRVIQLQNIGDGKFLDEYRVFTSEEKADQLKNCNIYPGDIIIAKMADPVARACIIPDIDKRYLMASDGIRLSVNKEEYDAKFILYAINSPNFRKDAENHSTGTTRLRIGLTELKNLLIAIPPSKEQKRIAEILTTVDEAIEKTAQVIENTKEMKKGLMQKLLTRGIGHKKFKKTKIGEIPEEWKVKKLVDTARNEKYSLTGGPFGSDLKEDSYTESGVRVIQLQNIGDGKFLDEYRVFTSEEKADQLKNCNIYPGDIIIAKMADPVARACMIPGSDDRYLMASDGIRLSVNKTKHDVNFVLYAINSPYFRKNAEKHSTGTTRLRIGLTELKNLPIGIPPLEEQKQITEILSSVDGEIERESGHKERLELLKKGLMQVLLTGKIRVVL
jgi:type I restriction enzyme S subunit